MTDGIFHSHVVESKTVSVSLLSRWQAWLMRHEHHLRWTCPQGGNRLVPINVLMLYPSPLFHSLFLSFCLFLSFSIVSFYLFASSLVHFFLPSSLSFKIYGFIGANIHNEGRSVPEVQSANTTSSKCKCKYIYTYIYQYFGKHTLYITSARKVYDYTTHSTIIITWYMTSL